MVTNTAKHNTNNISAIGDTYIIGMMVSYHIANRRF